MARGTKVRHVRIDDELWAEFRTVAREHETDASAVIRDLIDEWLALMRPPRDGRA